LGGTVSATIAARSARVSLDVPALHWIARTSVGPIAMMSNTPRLPPAFVQQ
jgi:hypothetical protein